MFKVITYHSENLDGVEFELSALVNDDGTFYGQSLSCINYEKEGRRNSFDFMWDNVTWLRNEFYPLLIKAVEQNKNLYEISPELFDDVDIEDEGEPEMLKDERFYEDLILMFDTAIKDKIL